MKQKKNDKKKPSDDKRNKCNKFVNILTGGLGDII